SHLANANCCSQLGHGATRSGCRGAPECAPRADTQVRPYIFHWSRTMKSWRFAILLVVLLAGGAAVNAWEYLGEVHVDRRSLKEFPGQLGSWKQTGNDEQFDAETLAVLRASDYLLRNYRSDDGHVVNFYVGYYA